MSCQTDSACLEQLKTSVQSFLKPFGEHVLPQSLINWSILVLFSIKNWNIAILMDQIKENICFFSPHSSAVVFISLDFALFWGNNQKRWRKSFLHYDRWGPKELRGQVLDWGHKLLKKTLNKPPQVRCLANLRHHAELKPRTPHHKVTGLSP